MPSKSKVKTDSNDVKSQHRHIKFDHQNHLHLPINTERAFGELYDCPLQLHGDFADCGFIVHHLMSQLDVKVFIAGRTV